MIFLTNYPVDIIYEGLVASDGNTTKLNMYSIEMYSVVSC